MQRATLARRFTEVRKETMRLVLPLEVEDFVIQSMPDVSPTKWHMAHTTWFFETFVLAPFANGYAPHNPAFGFLFNSYYLQVGQMHPRERRGVLSRPTVAEVSEYRLATDARVLDLIESAAEGDYEELARRIELGLHHEQQHQELLLMDIKHVFSCNPMLPAYHRVAEESPAGRVRLEMLPFSGGTVPIGTTGEAGFHFDNESPVHEVVLRDYGLANRLVTNEEYTAFVSDGGYERPEFWLSDGWATVQSEGWKAPLYWLRRDDAWWEFGFSGAHPLRPAAPVCHVSFYEADAYARWANARLPTEHEWEHANRQEPLLGNFLETGRLETRAAGEGRGLQQSFGDVWEITSSAYLGYPGYRVSEGALGEYNGKFMSGQVVLRGGSCLTPESHIRHTYRNFFGPQKRWCAQGIRLAMDAEKSGPR